MRVPVSVVIPCYRAAATIRRAVQSVVSQTALPEELVLVDDASPDGGQTLAELHALRTDFASAVPLRVVALRQNQGPSAARNAGWTEASQPLIAFLDADDAWHPRKLELQGQWMLQHPEVSITGHRYRVLPPGAPSEWVLPEHWSVRGMSYRRLLLLNQFPTPTVMLRRGVPYRFPEHLHRLEDFSLWLRILSDGLGGALLELPLACLYKPEFGHGGLSGDLWAMERAELQMYTELLREDRLRRREYWPLVSLSLVKFGRRVALTQARRWRSPPSR